MIGYVSKVNMVLNVHRNHKAYQGRGEEGGGEGVCRWGKREILYLSLHCHHQSDSCIKMGSDESHFNVSLIVRNELTRLSTSRAEAESNRSPSAYQPDALPLGQTGSPEGRWWSAYLKFGLVRVTGFGSVTCHTSDIWDQ